MYSSNAIEPRILLGSSQDASKMLPEYVGKARLVVTSPPYHNAISYESHALDPTADYRQRAITDYAGEYLQLMNSVWAEMWKMLRPGGIIAINVGSVLDDGYHFPLPMDIIQGLEDAEEDWQFIRSILWHKVTAGVKRAGSVIQHPYPGYWHPNIMTEHIIVFRKGSTTHLVNRDCPEEWYQPVWDLAPVPPRTVEHPAPFPEDLPHRLIRLFTNEKDIVIDPFNGAGSTTKSATDLGRLGVGFDIEKKYVDLAVKRIDANAGVRKMQLVVAPIHRKDFVPNKAQGKTRHGAGLQTRAGKK